MEKIMEKKALEIQKELRQMEQENRESLRRSGEADVMDLAQVVEEEQQVE